MKTIITAFTAIMSLLLLTQCKKDNTVFNSYFYTSMDEKDVQLSLYIDKQYKGELPYLTRKPSACDNDTLKQKALFLALQSGKYTVETKDKQGNIKSSFTLKIKSNSMQVRSIKGGNETELCNGCLVAGLYY